MNRLLKNMKRNESTMKKWILRILAAIMVVCILTGIFYTGKGYLMYRAALLHTSRRIAQDIY